MKRFNALKKVNATPMTRQAYNDYRDWKLPEGENGDDEGYLTEDIDGPINTDEFMGYVSWTPKAMFDDQFYEVDDERVGELVESDDKYHTITSDDRFDFGLAIQLVKEGAKVARQGWNGKGMFVYHVPAASYPAQRNKKGVLVGQFENNMVPYREYLALKTAQGDIATWSPSTSDALAEDWILIK